jgi:hypothetical protein
MSVDVCFAWGMHAGGHASLAVTAGSMCHRVGAPASCQIFYCMPFNLNAVPAWKTDAPIRKRSHVQEMHTSRYI